MITDIIVIFFWIRLLFVSITYGVIHVRVNEKIKSFSLEQFQSFSVTELFYVTGVDFLRFWDWSFLCCIKKDQRKKYLELFGKKKMKGKEKLKENTNKLFEALKKGFKSLIYDIKNGVPLEARNKDKK